MGKQLIIFFVITLLLISGNVFSQIKKEVDNQIFVTFPCNPNYSLNNKVSTYNCLTNNCFYNVMVLKNILPNEAYEVYIKNELQWTDIEKQEIDNRILNGFIKGYLYELNTTGTITELKNANYLGKAIEYYAINPLDGEKGKRYAVVFFVRNTILTFDVTFLKGVNDISEKEKNMFLNSIILN